MFNKIIGTVALTVFLLMISLCIYDMTNDLPRAQDHHVLAGYCLIALVACAIVFLGKLLYTERF